MTKRPFIAFSTIDGNVLARASTATEARDEAVRFHRLDDDCYVEVLDFAGRADCMMRYPHPFLSDVSHLGRTVFRGSGYEPHQPAVALEPDVTSASD